MPQWKPFFAVNCNPPVSIHVLEAGSLFYNYAILKTMMKTPRDYWPVWAETLRRYQLDGLVASLIEAGGPLTMVGAQALYFGRGFINSDQLQALARTLEEEDEVRAFASFLAQETAQ
jgi:hypothetical protein